MASGRPSAENAFVKPFGDGARKRHASHSDWVTGGDGRFVPLVRRFSTPRHPRPAKRPFCYERLLQIKFYSEQTYGASPDSAGQRLQVSHVQFDESTPGQLRVREKNVSLLNGLISIYEGSAARSGRSFTRTVMQMRAGRRRECYGRSSARLGREIDGKSLPRFGKTGPKCQLSDGVLILAFTFRITRYRYCVLSLCTSDWCPNRGTRVERHKMWKYSGRFRQNRDMPASMSPCDCFLETFEPLMHSLCYLISFRSFLLKTGVTDDSSDYLAHMPGEPRKARDLEFHGVMRFYFQDSGQKVATKCIRVASDATATVVIETLIEKFRPDMRMLSIPEYALYEIHENGGLCRVFNTIFRE
ncbi:unnamed protein product [Nesidiocoris tenuis]|uniref:Ras-associating domain-containing protein n=1 Tax=Nesidiocoris tenuis TaxID=355587 RepID=A0A6H5G768_9HEMI|nr:unnamed protein product [Nesidiocoris tenuis]